MINNWPLARNGLLMAATGAALAPGLWALLRSEPNSFGSTAPLYLLVAAAIVMTLVLVPPAARRGQRRVVVLPLTALALALVSIRASEALHWARSRTDFERLADSGDLACSAASPCMVGWWRVRDIEHTQGAVVFWLVGGTVGCYAGHGLARANGPATALAPDAIRQPSSYVAVKPWRDDWYEVCVRT